MIEKPESTPAIGKSEDVSQAIGSAKESSSLLARLETLEQEWRAQFRRGDLPAYAICAEKLAAAIRQETTKYEGPDVARELYAAIKGLIGDISDNWGDDVKDGQYECVLEAGAIDAAHAAMGNYEDHGIQRQDETPTQVTASVATGAGADDDMCDEHRAEGGDPECLECFKQNYEDIGRELCEAIKQQMPDYSYNNSPVEVVGDLLQRIDDLAAPMPLPDAPARAVLEELRAIAEDCARTGGQRAGVPLFVPSVAKRVLEIVKKGLAASESQGEGLTVPALVPLPDAAPSPTKE